MTPDKDIFSTPKGRWDFAIAIIVIAIFSTFIYMYMFNKQDDSDFWWILGTLIIFFLVLVGFGYKYKDSLKSEFNKIFLHGDKDVKVASKIKKPQTLNTSQIQ